MTRSRKERRTKTNKVRRRPIREVQLQYRHTDALDCLQVHTRVGFQSKMLEQTDVATLLINDAIQLVANACAVPDRQNELLDQADLLTSLYSAGPKPLYEYYEHQEALLCDIPDEVYERPFNYKPERNRRIDDLDDFQCLHFTNFTRSQLRRILRLFNLPEEILVRCSETQQKHYHFHREELLLFALVKCAKGWDNVTLCECFFGGCPRRWSTGYPWFLRYAHERYYPTILGLNGLEREVQNFKYYASKIAKKFNRTRFYTENHTGEHIPLESTTIDEDTCRVCMFVDGSVSGTAAYGSGPNGDYEGAMRKDDSYLNQRAIYNTYKKEHGLMALSFMVPNGIHYIIGPYSIRQNDNAVLNLSGADDFLVNLQVAHNPHVGGNGNILYAAYGDKLFNIRQCIISAHRGDELNPLTEQERKENTGFNAIRILIENAFALIANKWRICSQNLEFKLGQKNPHAAAQLAFCYLLSNMSVCFHGSIVGATESFACAPPSIEEYMELGDEERWD